MVPCFELIFDDVIGKQLKKAAKNQDVKNILSKMFDKLEEIGPEAGELLDSKLFIYEFKSKRPPIRLYFKHEKDSNRMFVFEFEMKTSEKKQKRTIDKLRSKVSDS